MRRLAPSSFVILALIAAVAVIALAAACGDDTTPDVSTPAAPSAAETGAPAATPAASADGATLFADNCAGCHGSTGSGGQGPDIRNEDDAAEVIAQVSAGGGGMPAFEGSLSATEIEAIAAYVSGGQLSQ